MLSTATMTTADAVFTPVRATPKPEGFGEDRLEIEYRNKVVAWPVKVIAGSIPAPARAARPKASSPANGGNELLASTAASAAITIFGYRPPEARPSGISTTIPTANSSSGRSAANHLSYQPGRPVRIPSPEKFVAFWSGRQLRTSSPLPTSGARRPISDRAERPSLSTSRTRCMAHISLRPQDQARRPDAERSAADGSVLPSSTATTSARPCRGIEDAQRATTWRRLLEDDFTCCPTRPRFQCCARRTAHARIDGRSSTAAALARMPGVKLLVLTGADVLAEGLKPVPHPAGDEPARYPPSTNLDGSPAPARAADDSPRPTASASSARAWPSSSPQTSSLKPRTLPKRSRSSTRPCRCRWMSIAVDLPGSAIRRRTRAGFAEAEHVVRLETDVQRIATACRWSRAPRLAPTIRRPAATRYMPVVARWCGRRTSSRSSSARTRRRSASLPRETGGNFGTRYFLYPEFVLVAWAAKKIGRPVIWNCERGEAFLSDYAARDLRVESELAISADGKFLGLHAKSSDQQCPAPLHRLLHSA